MPPPKTPLRLPKGLVPLAIQIIPPSGRGDDQHPYTAGKVPPRFAFTLNLLAETRIQEIACHAAEYVRQKLNAYVDETRLEARDRDGHVFTGQETISDELMSGEAVFLIENGRGGRAGREEQARGRGQGRESSSGRGRAASRTPSTTSRPSSVRKSRARSEPRRTASQRALDIAQGRAVAKTDPRGSLLSSSTTRRRRPLPLDIFAVRPEDRPLPSIEHHPREIDTPARPRQDARSPSGYVARRRGPTVDLTGGKAASATANASQSSQPPLSPSTSLPVEDGERDLPSARDAPPQARRSTKGLGRPIEISSESNHQKSSPQVVAQQQPRSSPSLEVVKSTSSRKALVEARQTPRKLQSKPDPYDINVALSDEANPTPNAKDILSASVRRLGSSNKRPAVGELSKTWPPRPGIDHTSSPPRNFITTVDQTVIASTPKAQGQLPRQACAELSSTSNALPSSPTDHIAATVAQGYAKARRQPHPDYIVIPETDDEGDERVFRRACDRFSSPAPGRTSSDGSLPWARPPLRVSEKEEEDPFWSVRAVGRRPGAPDNSQAVKRQTEDNKKNVDAGSRQLLDMDRRKVLGRIGGGSSDVEVLSDDGMRPVAVSSRTETPSKATPTSTIGKSPVVVIHGSSSEEPADEEINDSIQTIHGSSSEDLGSVDLGSEAGQSGRISRPTARERAPARGHWPSVVKHPEVAIQDGKDSQEKNGNTPGGSGSTTGLPVDDELSMDPIPESLDVDKPKLPVGGELQDDNSGVQEWDPKLSSENTPPGDQVFRTDPLMILDDFDTPPSAQLSKRKRELSDDENIIGETARKRARKEEEAARRARKERRLETRRAKEADEKARLYEERKRLALEQAHRRAKALEIIVSSPLRAAEMGLELSEGYDSDQESGPAEDTSPLKRMRVPPSFEGSDNTDSLSSKESEGRPSWRKLSRRQFSISSHGRSERKGADSAGCKTAATVASASTSLISPASQNRPVSHIKETSSQRRDVNHWAFLDVTLGQGTYSPWEVHNSVHLAMVQASLRALASESSPDNTSMAASKREPKRESKVKDSSTTEPPPKSRVERESMLSSSPLVSPPYRVSSGNEDGDRDLKTRRSIQSSAPSPGEWTAQPPATINSRRKGKGTKKSTKAKKQRKRHKKSRGTYKGLREAFAKKSRRPMV